MRAGAVTLYLGLGSNLGDSAALLQQAIHELPRHGVGVRRCSSLYRGPYLGSGSPQPDYWNACVEACTSLVPLALLDATQAVEKHCGRLVPAHGRPRRLDVDILFYGGWRVLQPRLVVPHPRLGERRFVLEPLAELGVLDGLGPGLQARLQQLRGRQVLERLPFVLSPGDARAPAAV